MSTNQIVFGTPARLWILGFVLAGIVSAGAGAQELVPQAPKQQGGFFVPMLTVGETLEDNLFFTQFPESDLITRLGLGLETGYRSTPLTVDVVGLRAADFFEQHPDFDTTRGKTLGQLAFAYLPVRPLTLSVFACYLDTQTPSELNVASGLAVGRSLATRISGAPVVEYRLGSLSTLTGSFPVAHDTLDGHVADTLTGSAWFDRRVSRRDTVSLRYEHRWFSFTGGAAPEKSTADVVTLGWMGEVGERTFVLLRAGPRYGKGDLTAEILATMKRRVKGGLVTVTYAKSQATTLGKSGALDTQSVSGTLAVRIKNHLEIGSGPGFYRNALHGQRLIAMRLNVEALWRFSPWLHLGAAYSFDLQQPDFGAPGHIRRGAFQVRLLTSPPQRRPEDPLSGAPEEERD